MFEGLKLTVAALPTCSSCGWWLGISGSGGCLYPRVSAYPLCLGTKRCLWKRYVPPHEDTAWRSVRRGVDAESEKERMGENTAWAERDQDREEALELLKGAGFTEAQADVLATMYEVLMAECHRAPPAPSEAERAWHEAKRESAPTPPSGGWQHPGLADLFPVIAKLLPDLLELLMSRLRPPPEPPRPWWQRRLRRLAGI